MWPAERKGGGVGRRGGPAKAVQLEMDVRKRSHGTDTIAAGSERLKGAWPRHPNGSLGAFCDFKKL